MRIVLLSTAKGLRPAAIDDVRARLSLHKSDEICVVSWYPPRNPLPVEQHLVLGAWPRLGRNLVTVQRVQQRPDLISALPQEVPESIATETATPAETAAPTDPAGATTRPADSTKHLPILHPRRMRRAVAWRLRRLRGAWRVRRLKRAARARASSRLARVRRHPKFRNVRNRVSLGVSLGFAAGCLRAGRVHDLTRYADLVVALDTASHRGAWTLAQKVHGPEVVIGIPAAKRLLEQRDVSAPT